MSWPLGVGKPGEPQAARGDVAAPMASRVSGHRRGASGPSGLVVSSMLRPLVLIWWVGLAGYLARWLHGEPLVPADPTLRALAVPGPQNKTARLSVSTPPPSRARDSMPGSQEVTMLLIMMTAKQNLLFSLTSEIYFYWFLSMSPSYQGHFEFHTHNMMLILKVPHPGFMKSCGTCEEVCSLFYHCLLENSLPPSAINLLALCLSSSILYATQSFVDLELC